MFADSSGKFQVYVRFQVKVRGGVGTPLYELYRYVRP